MSDLPNYYDVLHVSRQASYVEIKKAFRRLARQSHPDLHPKDPEAASQFKRLSEAYEVLSDPLRRSQYDAAHFDQSSSNDTASPSKQGQSFQLLYLQGVDKLSQRDYRGAITDFTQAISLFPAGVEAYLGRAQAYDALHQDRPLLDDCYQILQRNPNSAQAYVYQGQARARLGYPQGAIEAYSKAITLDAAFAQAYYRRAQARLILKDVDLARQDLEQAISHFRAQQKPTQAHQAQTLLNGLKSTPLRNASQPSPPRRNTSSFWTLAFANLPRVVLNPNENLLPTFAKLTPQRAGIVGLLYGLMTVGCILLSGAIYRIDPFPYARFGLTATVAYGSAVGVAAIARRLVRGRGSLGGDIYIIGVAALPIAIFALGMGSLLSVYYAWIALGVFTFCHSILILYVGCTQISSVDASRAMGIVPCIVYASIGSALWMLRTF